MMADIAFFEVFTEEEEKIRRHLPPSLNPVFYKETVQESGERVAPSRFVSIRTQSAIPVEWHDQIDAVLTRSQGYDHIHRMFTNCAKPMALGYLGPYCSRAVAEHAVLVMMMLLKKIKCQLRQFGRFQRDGLTGAETSRRRVLIFGVGQIGSEIGRLCRAWDMDVRGVDIQPKWEGIEYVSLDEGLAWAQVIFCAATLNSATEGLLTHARLSAAEGAVFVNISRGEISPVDDLIRLVDEGRLSGVGLDVYPDESELGDHMRRAEDQDPAVGRIRAFADYPNVICTPHNAFNTVEALDEKSRRTIEAVSAFFESGRFPCPVPPVP